MSARHGWFSFVLLGAVIVSGCRNGETPVPDPSGQDRQAEDYTLLECEEGTGETDTTTVTPDAEHRLTAGGHSLLFVRGAVPEARRFGLHDDVESAGRIQAGEHHGPTEFSSEPYVFAKRIQMTLSWDGCNVEGIDPETIEIVRLSPLHGGPQDVLQAVRRDPQASTVTAETDRLSEYMLAAPN